MARTVELGDGRYVTRFAHGGSVAFEVGPAQDGGFIRLVPSAHERRLLANLFSDTPAADDDHTQLPMAVGGEGLDGR